MRYKIVCQLVCEFIHCRTLAPRDLPVLLLQLVDAVRTGAAGRLVGSHMHAPNMRQPLYGRQCNDHLYRRAVGVGDDAARCVESVVGVDFGHHQRHIVVHAERTRIIDHDSAVARDRPGIFARDARTGRDQCDIHTTEIRLVRQLLDLDLAAPKYIFLSGTATRPEQPQTVDSHIAALQYIQKLLSHGAARAHYCYCHNSLSLYIQVIRKTPPPRSRTSWSSRSRRRRYP